MCCTRSELTEIPWCEPLYEPDLTEHAEGRTCLSEKRRSEKRQADWTGHAEGRARLSEEQHTENGAHHLKFLLLNHFSSNLRPIVDFIRNPLI